MVLPRNVYQSSTIIIGGKNVTVSVSMASDEFPASSVMWMLLHWRLDPSSLKNS